MRNPEGVFVGPHATIRDAVQRIDAGAMQIAVVVDADGMLLGLVTDGDVRRGLLAGRTLEDAVATIMNRHPVTVTESAERDRVLQTMRARGIHQIPVVDPAGRVVGIHTLDALLDEPSRPNEVVILAGGRGERLMPLTNDTPKPLLHVGDRPILQRLVESCAQHGLHRIHLAVNYKAQMIRNHFGDGARFGVEIRYIEEQTPLGTAGCLALLASQPESPVLVMNGDLLTTVNLGQLLDFHAQQGAAATMCVREYTHIVPYGVVRLDGHRLVGVEEKPTRCEFVNAGIYVLSPHVVARVPTGRRYDMTSAFQDLCDAGEPVAVFPIREYWLDIGRHPDLEQARADAGESGPPPSA